ncbi:MAG: hypothetical protein ACI8UO_001827 [Verrucomicrobiales bacterium]|jgi:hypothetical protein
MRIFGIFTLVFGLSSALSADQPTHWAFQQLLSPEPPVVANSDWPKSDLDHFILARLEAEKLDLATDADPVTLARRLYFNLIGLPPTPEQIAAFDESKLEAVVDDLLASPRFGEKWGRHWLDLARYAESNGKDRDVVFPHAWRYRDYVINALNSDMPYDQFVREQIAGDLLDRGDDGVIATAFLTLGPKAFQEVNMEKFTMDVVDEQIDVMSRSILGLTIACARCHDHKFDPIPTADYYALAGVFLSSDNRYGPGPLYVNKHPKDTDFVPIGDRIDELHPTVAAWRAEVLRLTEEVTGIRSAAYRIQRQVTGELRDRGLKKPEDDLELLKLDQKRAAMTADATAKNELREKMIKTPPAEQPGYTMAILHSEEPPEDCKIRVRGVHDEHGEKIPRGRLTIPGMPDVGEIKADESGRKQLADWLTSAKNPLTARVYVNRVWRHLFGRGLVRTTDNFGISGESPSHPELLDFLAAEFMADGWSTKNLIKRIVLSRTWQLSSKGDPANAEVDPENTLLWRANFRRLDIEQFRDSVLAVSQQLLTDPPDGSMMKDVYAGADYGTGGHHANFEEQIANDRHRTVYLPIVRNSMPEALQLFDFADPNATTGDRNARTIPSQALYLMNNPFVEREARNAAERILKTPESDRVELAYLLTSGRLPGPGVAGDATSYLASRTAQADEIEAWTDLMQTLFASARFRYLD